MPKRKYFTLLLAGTVLGVLAVAWGCGLFNGKKADPAEEAEAAEEDLKMPGIFKDVTKTSNIRFTYHNGQAAGHYAILESLGGGVALIDYDGDGLLDIFVTGGGHYTGKGKKTIKGYPCKLYKNLGNFQFKDVTREVGLDKVLFYSHGAAVGDFNRDGWPDLLVTGYGRLALYENVKNPKGGRMFVEVTKKVGLLPDHQFWSKHDTGAKLSPNHFWSTSAAWADLDGDG
jgi:hypothetical protein